MVRAWCSVNISGLLQAIKALLRDPASKDRDSQGSFYSRGQTYSLEFAPSIAMAIQLGYNSVLPIVLLLLAVPSFFISHQSAAAPLRGVRQTSDDSQPTDQELVGSLINGLKTSYLYSVSVL